VADEPRGRPTNARAAVRRPRRHPRRFPHRAARRQPRHVPPPRVKRPGALTPPPRRAASAAACAARRSADEGQRRYPTLTPHAPAADDARSWALPLSTPPSSRRPGKWLLLHFCLLPLAAASSAMDGASSAAREAAANGPRRRVPCLGPGPGPVPCRSGGRSPCFGSTAEPTAAVIAAATVAQRMAPTATATGSRPKLDGRATRTARAS
jgi:hypothetical protein